MQEHSVSPVQRISCTAGDFMWSHVALNRKVNLMPVYLIYRKIDCMKILGWKILKYIL